MVVSGKVVATSSGIDVEEVQEKLFRTYYRIPAPAAPKRRKRRKPRD